MEKDEGQTLAQQKIFQLKELNDWSFQSYKDDITRDEDNTEEPMARWIVKKKHEQLLMEQPDQLTVKDLIINTEQHALDKKSEGDHDSMESFIKEAFKNIQEPIMSRLINYLGISDPSNS